jgi:hypothetical protein
MEEIITYRAIDGKDFSKKTECLEYESFIEKVEEIISTLPARPNTEEYNRGGGYIQHEDGIVQSVARKLYELCLEYNGKGFLHLTPSSAIFDGQINVYSMRVMTGNACETLDHSWSRLMCIDKENREWSKTHYLNEYSGRKVKLLYPQAEE